MSMYTSDQLGLLITTCQHYFTNIPNVIKNIEDCNFPKENVLIVSGQETTNSICYENGIKIVKVDYTGLHLTGVVYLSENMDSFNHINYWIILPDTIKLEKSFYGNILKYYNEHLVNVNTKTKISRVILPFVNPSLRPTMDMGIVHISHIYNMSDYLKKIKKAHPYNVGDILRLKNQLIYDENIILGLPAAGSHKLTTRFGYMNRSIMVPTKFITNHRRELIEKRINVNDKLVNEVYFVNLGMYKYQRNFSGPRVKLVIEL